MNTIKLNLIDVGRNIDHIDDDYDSKTITEFDRSPDLVNIFLIDNDKKNLNIDIEPVINHYDRAIEPVDTNLAPVIEPSTTSIKFIKKKVTAKIPKI